MARRRARYYKKWDAPDRIETQKFKTIKAQVKRRDKCVCTLCEKYRKGGEVHHIRSWAANPRLRYEERNCCYVCFRCHNKYLKNNEDGYIAILTEKVRQKYE